MSSNVIEYILNRLENCKMFFICIGGGCNEVSHSYFSEVVSKLANLFKINEVDEDEWEILVDVGWGYQVVGYVSIVKDHAYIELTDLLFIVEVVRRLVTS